MEKKVFWEFIRKFPWLWGLGVSWDLDKVEITATRWNFPLATFMWTDEVFWVWNSGQGIFGYWERCYVFADSSSRPYHQNPREWRFRIIGNMMRWSKKALIASVRRCEDGTGGHYTKITIYKPPIGSSFSELARECIGTKP